MTLASGIRDSQQTDASSQDRARPTATRSMHSTACFRGKGEAGSTSWTEACIQSPLRLSPSSNEHCVQRLASPLQRPFLSHSTLLQSHSSNVHSPLSHGSFEHPNVYIRRVTQEPPHFEPSRSMPPRHPTLKLTF